MQDRITCPNCSHHSWRWAVELADEKALYETYANYIHDGWVECFCEKCENKFEAKQVVAFETRLL